MARKSTLPPADLIVDLLRGGRTVKDIAHQCDVSIATVYSRLNRGGYTAADWMVDAGHREGGPISFAEAQEAQRRKAAAEAVVAEIEASTRAGRIVVPEDRSEVTDDELDDVIEKLTWERMYRRFRRQAEEQALHDRLPDCVSGVLHKSEMSHATLLFSLDVDESEVELRWPRWVELARDIIDADQMAWAAVVMERAA